MTPACCLHAAIWRYVDLTQRQQSGQRAEYVHRSRCEPLLFDPEVIYATRCFCPGKSRSCTHPVRVRRKFSEAFEQVEERIRELAYRLFLGREPGEGDSVSDWLQAQAQVLSP